MTGLRRVTVLSRVLPLELREGRKTMDSLLDLTLPPPSLINELMGHP